MRLFKLVLIVLCLAACGQAITPAPPMPGTQSPQRATQIARDPVLVMGQQQYNLRCAHCHGYDGEGQLAATIENTRSLGMNLVPPHNSTGHTWQHPDQLLVRVIKEGVSNPLDQFPMEPYAEVMTDEEIDAVLAYMKLWWTAEQRAQQRQLTQRWAQFDQQFGSGDS